MGDRRWEIGGQETVKSEKARNDRYKAITESRELALI